MVESHDNLVARQFSAGATAYIASAVHAEGNDLMELATMVGADR